jgi:O-antigen/teichoic acid export membrane protein
MFKGIVNAILAAPMLRHPVAKWRSSRLTRSVAAMAGGTAFAQGVSLLTAPITTRLYGPADYGMAAVFSSVLGVLLLPATWRYEMALMLPAKEEDARSVLWACLGLACGASLLSVVVMLLFGKWAFAALGSPDLFKYWWMLPPAILGGSLYQCFSVWALRRKEYFTLTGTKLRQAVVGSIVTIGLGCVWKGPLGLLIGSVCFMTMGVGRLARGTFHKGHRVGVAAFARRVWDALRIYRRFAFLTTGATFLNAAGTLIAPMLFSVCYTQAVVGHFSLAQRIVSLPGTLVGTAVGQVFIGEAAEMIRERPGELPNFIKKVTRKMAPFSMAVLLIGLSCPWVFPVVFGARWHTAGVLAAILSVLAAVQLLVSPIADISVLLQRQGLQFGLGAVRTVIVFGTIWLPSRLGMGPIFAVACYTLGMSLMWSIAYLFYARIARESRAPARRPVALTAAA